MVFKRGKRRPSRRGGKRRKVVRRLTASGINRALTSVRSFRGQELGTIVTTATFANLPVRIGPVIGTTTAASFNNTGGQIFFSLAQLKAMWSEAANPAAVPTLMVPDSTYSFETNYSANPIKTYGNWVKAQVRNVSLNPISIDIYDTFFAKE